MATVAEVLYQAVQQHQAGNLHLAEQLYHKILHADPGHAEAHYLLGAALQIQGKLEEARVHYERALLLNPSYAEVHCNLGLVLHLQGELDQAEAHCREALRLHPGFPEAHNNLGTILLDQGNPAEAAECFQHALRHNATFAEAYNNLGNALERLDKVDEAIDCYRQALRLNPNFAETHTNLGIALARQDKLDEAIRCHQQALLLKPDYAEAYTNLGNVLASQDKLDEAIRCHRRALDLNPGVAQAHSNVGCALLRQGLVDQALASFRQALRLQPNLAAARSNLVACSNYDPHADPDSVFAEHCRWGQTMCDVRGAMCDVKTATSDIAHRTSHIAHTDPERRLRVGYVSPDLRQHALASYFEPVLAHHDPGQVDVFCYAEVPCPDGVTARLQSLAHGWRSTCRLTDVQLAELIRSDRIDILVDLAGHTAGNRLGVFAHKPAPVQCTWLGYMNTTGLTTVDYRLTDEVLDPPGQPVRDTEELVRLQGGMCCFAAPADAPAVGPLPALSRGYLTFGSLHNLFKLNEQVFDLWSDVLRALPGARLLVFRNTLTATLQEHVRRQFTQRGIAKDRLDLRQGSGGSGYLGVYREIDVSLDAFPCTGGVTTCESLWMGVPVLSLCGVRPAGRNSAALLARVGLTDWAVESTQKYLAFAVQLPNDLDRLARLRTTLRDGTAATLCDAGRFTRGLEDAYRAMWRRWCAEQGKRQK